MSKFKPKVIDLFSGVGGLSLGAARAGFDVHLAVENDIHAIKSHAINFPNSRHWNKDISKVGGVDLLNEASLKGVEGIIGGPPCQGFSTMGRRNVKDPRNALYLHFYQLVLDVLPSFFIAENVPGILAENNKGILDEAMSIVSGKYDLIGPFKLSASELGAPTTRTRVFVVGVRAPYSSEKIKNRISNLVSYDKIFVKDALVGLPEVVDHNWRHANFNHWKEIIKIESERDFYKKLYFDVPKGIGDEEALRRLYSFSEVSGCVGTVHRTEVAQRYGLLKSGEMDRVSKSVRLDPNGFCPTLRAGTASDKGSYQAVRPIHPFQSRVITPREAARLQGFPDWFQFHETKWHSFRQIGNSVSPIVSESLLKAIINSA
ncbi:DNA cytosine methyltransferase [Halomonas sp. AOP13-D3-9]